MKYGTFWNYGVDVIFFVKSHEVQYLYCIVACRSSLVSEWGDEVFCITINNSLGYAVFSLSGRNR